MYRQECGPLVGDNTVSLGVISSLESASTSAEINTTPNLTEMKLVPTSIGEYIDHVEY